MTRMRTTLTLTALTLALAGGAALAAAAAAGDEPRRATQMKLVLAHDGAHEKIVLDNLHELAVGESRSFSTESGKAAVVTRTEKGFTIDLDGEKITVGDEPDAALGGDGDAVVLRKRIEIGDDDDAQAMVWHSGAAGGGREVKVIHRIGAADGNFAFVAGPQGARHFEQMTDAWIERLRQSADFQALDAATREKVEAALRSTAPKPPAEAGSTVVLELDDEARESGAH